MRGLGAELQLSLTVSFRNAAFHWSGSAASRPLGGGMSAQRPVSMPFDLEFEWQSRK